MDNYYSEKLSAQKLKRAYDIAPFRVQQYLEAEILHVMEKIPSGGLVLCLGCGYGRVMKRLLKKKVKVVGIDTSFASLLAAKEYLRLERNYHLAMMDAIELGFPDRVFNTVICVQNGISAFKVDQHQLILEAIRVAQPGGVILFSSYSEKFWEYRLEWFQLQADYGMIGEIDYERTVNGTIVCKDGFLATTIGPKEFEVLTGDIGVQTEIMEVDGSSIFCQIIVP